MSENLTIQKPTSLLKSPRNIALKIALIYAGISVAWIMSSDRLLSIITKDIETITQIQMFKGWFFVLASSYLIFLLLQKEIKKCFKAEEALQRSQTQLQSIMNAMPIALSWADDKENIQYINNKFYELFGYTLQDMPTVERWFQLAYPDQKYRQTVGSDWMISVENAQNSGPEIKPLEVAITCKDGSTRYVEIMGTILHNRILAVFNDLTERKQLDQELQLLHRWIEQSIDLFFWVREDSQLLYVNQAVCDSLGYTKEELHNMKVSDFDIGLPISAWSGFAQKLKDQGSYYFETRLRRKDGMDFPVEIAANVVNYDGKAHFFAYGRDISAKINAEKERKELETQLRQTQKMEAIGTLAGGIAHDFNNILSAIIGYNELLQMDLSENSKEFEYTQQIQQAGIRAKDLVQQILTFSRQTEQELKPVELGIIVKEVTKLLRSSFPATIEIKQTIEDNAIVMSDSTQLHQILMNLCTNAGHAMQEKGGVLAIDLKSIELKKEFVSDQIKLPPGIYVQLSVNDTGQGIPSEHLDRVFDPFFTTKKRGEGTGMGLSVVHGIIQSYKGAIHVYSELGVGSTFKIYLPSVERRAEQKSRRIKDIPKGTEHILFVDDEHVLVEMCTAQLESIGYKVSSRTNSLEALALVKKRPDDFDLVITDMTMPKMTGDELAREIKGVNPEIPVILCTGFSSKITSENIEQLDFDNVLMKPVILNEMAAVIRKTFDGK